jgi:hypothetical protein
VGIPGNEKADSAVKEALDEQIDRTEEYPPLDKMDYPTTRRKSANTLGTKWR